MTAPKAAAPKFDPATVDTTVIDRYAKLVTGNQNLVSAPDLVGALASGNATVQQAQAIDQYMGAQLAQQRVRVAMQAGTKITLNGVEKHALDALGVSYGAVEYTDELRQADMRKEAADQGLVAVDDEDGNFIGTLTQEQDRQRKAEEAKAKFESIKTDDGGWLNPITALKAGGSKVLGGATGAWNIVDYAISRKNSQYTGQDKQDAEDARLAGYDPDSTWSMLAYAASGKGYNSTRDLSADYGDDKVKLAKEYLHDPTGWSDRNVAENDAATAAANIKATNAPEFRELVQRVASRRAGVGNVTANTLGIDPVDNANWYRGVSAGTELAAQLLLDPTNAAFVARSAVKAAQIGLTGGAGDATTILRAFDTTNRAWYARKVQRTGQEFLDDVAVIGATGRDSVDGAAAFARINARTPAYVDVIPDVLGTRRLDTAGEVVDGNLPQIFNVAPITTLDDFAEFLGSKGGMLRVANGQAAVEGGFIPGAISRLGYREIRSVLADTTTRVSARRSAFRITDRNAGSFIPTAANAVDHAGNPIFQTAEDAAVAAATATGAARGDAARAAEKWNPAYRLAKAGARLVRFTPDSTKFVLSEAGGTENVRRYAGLFLTKFDANNLAAQYARGDEGARLAVLKGLEMQTLHAAGAGNTAAGRKLLSKVEEYQHQRYGLIDDKLPDATGTVRPFGIHEADFTGTFDLVNFRDLRKAMAKTTVWSFTGGRVFESQVVDHIMGTVKAGWLLTGTNIARNTLEPWTNIALRGEARRTLAAKAVATDAGGFDELPRTRVVEKLFSIPGLPAAGRAYRALLKHGIPDDQARYIALHAEKTNGKQLQSASAVHSASYLQVQNDADDLTRQGFGAVRMRAVGRSKLEVDAENQLSIDKLSDQLTRMAGTDPRFTRMTMRALTATTPQEADLAVADMVNHMNGPMARVFGTARRGNLYKDADGNPQPAVTDAEKILAKQQHARDIVADWKLALAAKGGKIDDRIIAEIQRTGTAPDGAWLAANLDETTLPQWTLQTDMMPVLPDGKVSTFIGRVADITGDGYATLIQKPIDRLTTGPMYYAGYGRARAGGAAFEQRMIADGMSPEAADTIMTKWAEQQAWQQVFKRTDNPTLKTQLDITGRNFFAFSRASQDFIRRWATTFVEDPGRLRRGQMALDAATSGGLVWTDPSTGQRNFTFPGTGPLLDKMLEVGHALHLPIIPEIPTSTNVSGRVVFLQPGLQNPAQISLTPIANLPMRQVMKLFPDSQQDLMQEIDMALNGEQGYGKSTLNQLAPSVVKKLMDLSDDDKDGMVASASKEAFAALMASDKYQDEPYEDWDANKKQNFLAALRVQTRNMLFLRQVMGLFAPAPPNIDQAGFDGEEADGVYGLIGVRGLQSEFKLILNQADGDKGKAVAIWSELHPDKMVYTVSGSEGTTKGAYLPATEATNSWMLENRTWLTENQNVAAYFIPADDTGGFSMPAWRAQQELGFRQSKSLEDYADDVAVVTSETLYYKEYDEYKSDLAEAQLKGDKVYVEQLKDQFSAWKADFYNQHPLFQEKQGGYGLSVNNAEHQIESLRAIVESDGGPDTIVAARPTLKLMLDAYDEHNTFAAANAGSTKKATADRAYEKAQYGQYVAGLAAQSPALTAVYNGVFRYLDKDLERIGG